MGYAIVFGGKCSWNASRDKGYPRLGNGKTYTMAYPMESMAYVMEGMMYPMA